MREFVLAIMVFFLWTNRIIAQTSDLGSWNILNLKYNHSDKWSAFGEGQIRSVKFYSSFHYYEYKFGLNYKVHENLQMTLAAGSYQTYNEGGNFALPKANDEFRIWPQVLFSQSIGKFKIEHRYRAEFRFTSSGYRNRYRYRIGASHPFGRDRNGYKPFQIGVSDEVFLNHTSPYFERNRLLIAFNFKPSEATTLQVGNLHQFDYKLNDETGKTFIVIGYSHDIFRRKYTPEK